MLKPVTFAKEWVTHFTDHLTNENFMSLNDRARTKQSPIRILNNELSEGAR